jgi:hypothetical protein
MRNNESRLQILNVACNEFTADNLEEFLLSLADNRSLIRMDVRGNVGYRKGNYNFSCVFDSYGSVFKNLLQYRVTEIRWAYT